MNEAGPLNEKLKDIFLFEFCASAVRNHNSAAFRATACGGVFTLDPRLNNIGGTPNPGGHTDSIRGTIFSTGAAFHTAVQIMNPGFFIVQEKDAVRTNHFTYTATHAFIFVESQGCHTGKISKIIHF
jgi:hypothetical protein